MRMKPSQRLDWIEGYIRDHGKINITDKAFLDAYLAATGVTFTGKRCQRLHEDLVSMTHDARLKRVRKPNQGVGGWVYTYFIPAVMSGRL